MKAFFKSLKKRDWIIIAIFVLCLGAFGVLTAVSNASVAKLYDQQTGKVWIPDSNTGAMVSVFLSGDAKVDYMNFGRLKKSISKEIVSSKGIDPSTLDPNEMFPGGFSSCFSAEGTINLSTDEKTADNMKVIGIGGDFFLFHPIQLASGCYLYEDDIMKDGLVLDSVAAYRLFGSFDVVGLKVMVGNIPFYVRGVYFVDESRESQLAGSADGYIFMDYDALARLGNAGPINCFEFVGEDIYDDFFIQTVTDLVKKDFGEDLAEVVDNTHRFGLLNRWEILTDGDLRVMKKNNIVYPYWENIARVYENRMAGILIIQVILLVIPTVILIAFLIHLYRNRKWSLKSIGHKFEHEFESVTEHFSHKDDKEQNKWKDF